ncbi:hypothetical protein BDF20DRAFT_894050 [Mycotypha africana]|uniref:uncharacterized protein n=1 Tax=Mycotypha africana TaxID=64632 RepID=UPI0023009DF6|nr:uncharacterized protein BDF20DRAFT_894050 [Mycotypha africana]KAI8969258.1 hypothetical protein BDF20DRAFT_894050 [Mycotypha africana]
MRNSYSHRECLFQFLMTRKSTLRIQRVTFTHFRDSHKIIARFEELIDDFNDVAVRMKQGNYSNFMRELKFRLLDLEYTRKCVALEKKKWHEKARSDESKESSLTMKAVDQAITTTKLMIDTLETSMTQMTQMISEKYAKIAVDDQTVEADSHEGKEKRDAYSSAIPADYKPKYVETLYPVTNFERKLRSLAQLCQEQPYKSEKGQTEETEDNNDDANSMHRLMRQSSITHTTATMIPLVFSMMDEAQQQQQQQQDIIDHTTNSTSSPPHLSAKISDFFSFSKDNPPNNNITIANAIKHDTYSDAITCIQRIVERLGKANIVLDLVDEENYHIKPLSSALTIGQTFMINFNNPPLRKEDASLPPSPLYKEKNSPIEDNTINSLCWFDKQFEMNTIIEEHNNDEPYHSMLFSAVELWKSRAENRRQGKLLNILRRFQSIIVDVIFALMTGRTVVIEGSQQNKGLVEETVRVLSLFVPGQMNQQHEIVEWFDKEILSNIEIDDVKLIGVEKQKVDSSIYINSSCVLDIDAVNGSLNSGPIYVEGQWINQFIDRVNLFTSDDAYLAYLHTIFMTISLKSCMYHHLSKMDEFNVNDNNSAFTASSPFCTELNRECISETNSEQSTISRRWSQRLMTYLRKNEAQQHQSESTGYDTSNNRQSASLITKYLPNSELNTIETQRENAEKEDYSEENQATVTLQSIQLKRSSTSSSRPRTVTDIFQQNLPTTLSMCDDRPISQSSIACTAIEGIERSSISSTNSSRRVSMASLNNDPKAIYTHFVAEDTKESNDDQLTMQDLQLMLNVNDLNSLDDDERESASTTCRSPRQYNGNDADSIEDSVTDTNQQQQLYDMTDIEQRGRYFLQKELKVYGDDQTIIIYLATNVL